MPYLIGNQNYYAVNQFLMRQQHWYLYSDRVWVQHIDMRDQCTLFAYETIEVGDCKERYPFICEIGKIFLFSLCSQIMFSALTIDLFPWYECRII